MNSKKLLEHCEKRNSRLDSFSSCQTNLVLMRMEIRCVMQQYLSLRAEIRGLERQQRKLRDSGVAIIFLEPLIKKRKACLEKVHACLVACGRLAMDALDRWQAYGATLKDLCNFCSYPNYRFIQKEVGQHSDSPSASLFSSIMFIFNLDYPLSNKCEWLDDTVDAPFTHAIKEFMLHQMMHTKEGRKASDEALKAVFPDIWENALIQHVDENGHKYFTDREGNRINLKGNG